MAEELVGALELDTQLPAHSLGDRVVGLGRHDRLGPEALTVGLHARRDRRSPTMVDLEADAAQLVCETPHGGHHEMEALAVVAATVEHPLALDHQDPVLAGLRIGHRAEVSVQLIAEDEDRPAHPAAPIITAAMPPRAVHASVRHQFDRTSPAISPASYPLERRPCSGA